MAEGEGAGAKVRVVRCPKCGKLLPELANFTVYRCGGCDATLQAKKQPTVFEASPEKSDRDLSKLEIDKLEFKGQGLNKTCADSLVNEKRDGLKSESPRMDSLPTIKPEAGDGKFQHRSMASSNSPGDNVEDNREAKAHVLFSNGHSKFRPTKAWDGEEEMANKTAFRGMPKVSMGDIPAAFYPVAGPSNYNRQNIEGSDRVELLEQDRAVLLRKLDELRDQIKQSHEVAEAPKERVPGHNGKGSWFPDGSSTLNRNPSHHSTFSNGHSVDMPGFYPAAHLQNGVHGYRETSRPFSLAPFNFHGQYPQRSSNGYIYGHFDPDPVSSYHNDGFYHQPACACMHCYNGHWLPPAQVPSAFLSNPRVPPCPLGNHGFQTVDGPSMFGSQGYSQGVPKAPFHPYEQRQHQSRKERRPCRPFAGAAPFIVCYNCSELLQIPQEILQTGKHQHKLRCGSCSQLVSFELDGRRLVSSTNTSTLPKTSENKASLNDGSKDVLQCHGNINRRQVISYSIDYDSPSYYDVRFADEKIVMPSFPISSNEVVEKECGRLSDSEKLHGLCSSSSTSGGGVESPDSVICLRDVPSSTELPGEADAITRVPSLPLREHFGYASGNKIVDDPGSGSRSKRSDQERIASYAGNLKQNSVKDVPVAIEMDLSAEDYPNAGFSQDSWDVSKEENEPRHNKGGDSFLTGLIKKSFKDFSPFNQSTECGRPKVSVNGHSISDRLVKRAEKLAGPIHPGYYWYDYRAGFWGVMGQPCLGIVPPFIEEFNFPMHKSCAAGNTGVLINGRELNHKDLTLLASRGLPVAEGRSYAVEISGKVWDEETGEELDCLGKLAPTVERVKRGFGMRAPRVNC